MSDSQRNVVPSRLYTTEGSVSKKKTKEELGRDDPTKEEGLAVVGGKIPANLESDTRKIKNWPKEIQDAANGIGDIIRKSVDGQKE